METKNIWPIYVMSKVVPSQAEPSNQALTHLQNVIHAYEWIFDKCPVQVPLAHEKIVCCGILFICFVYVFFCWVLFFSINVVQNSLDFDFFCLSARILFYLNKIHWFDFIGKAHQWNYQKKHDDFYVFLIG